MLAFTLSSTAIVAGLDKSMLTEYMQNSGGGVGAGSKMILQAFLKLRQKQVA